MRHHTFLVMFLVLALAPSALCLGERYLLPPAAHVTLTVTPEAGGYTLTGKARAEVVDLAEAHVTFRLPPEVEAVGAVPEHKGALTKGQEITLTAKVKLKDGARKAFVGFGADFEFKKEFWLDYIEKHKKEYPIALLRDLLTRETQGRAKRTTLSRVTVLERGK